MNAVQKIPSSPFQVFSWTQPFLPALKEFIERETDGQPGKALVIVPNNRPWRYFFELYKKAGKAALLPKMLPYTEMLKLWSAPHVEEGAISANELDLAALAKEAVAKAAESRQGLAGVFAKMETRAFMPWAFRLADIFEELYSEGLTGKDIPFARDDVTGSAAALLESLGEIGKHWLAGLKARRWTTPAYEALQACRNAHAIPPYLMPGPDRPVFIAGFYALDKVQEELFRSLWKNGAKICLHTHPDVASGKSAEAGTSLHIQWLRKWKAGAVAANKAESDELEPRVKFFQGYDTHSQLLEMQAILEENPVGSTAIILNDPASLLPALHQLPDKQINISLGYPADRSRLHNFIAHLFTLVKNRSADGKYYWKDLLKFLSQPFLEIFDGKSKKALGKTLNSAMAIVRNGQQHASADEISAQLAPHVDGQIMRFLKMLFNLALSSFQEIVTTRKLGQILQKISDFILEHGPDDWDSIPLEAEALTRLKSRIIPVLLENALADENLGVELLEAIYLDLMAKERIPFEADPLVGVQMLGMLETRLLQFDNVIMLDTTEDHLPGRPRQDPLLPDSLRSLLSLPNNRRAEQIAEHNFFRLCAGAKNINLLWQEGSIKSELFDTKKLRSRFIEQLLWRQEKKEKELIKAGSENYGQAIASLAMRPETPKILTRTPPLAKKLVASIKKSISATMLDQYFRCPLSFARSRLLGLAAPTEVNEGDAPPEVGIKIHKALQLFYEKYINKEMSKENFGTYYGELMEHFNREIADRDFVIPMDSRIMLETAAAQRFKKMLQEQPEETRVFKLEWEILIPKKLAGRDFNCEVIVDRIDARDGGHVILDYKTFHLKEFDDGLWQDEAFFQRLQEAIDSETFDSETNEELFLELRERLPSIQLPFYLTALRDAWDEETKQTLNPLGAAYVDLYNTGQEIPLFKASTPEDVERCLKYCLIAVEFVIKSLLASPVFSGNGATCGWCPHASLCAAV